MKELLIIKVKFKPENFHQLYIGKKAERNKEKIKFVV